jgi:hypothetical protein
VAGASDPVGIFGDWDYELGHIRDRACEGQWQTSAETKEGEATKLQLPQMTLLRGMQSNGATLEGTRLLVSGANP